MEIKIARPEDIDKLIPALLELRPHRSRKELKEMIARLMVDGVRLIYIGNDEIAFSVAAYRKFNMIFSGKTLYLDDLVTLSTHRGKGYAGRLMDWLIAYSNNNSYDLLSLDSGFNRKDAYRFYLNKGFEITAMHFAKSPLRHNIS